MESTQSTGLGIQLFTDEEIAGGIVAEVAERFTIDSEDKANWLLRKVANLEAEEARVKAQADSILLGLKTERSGLMNRFGAELEQWTKAQIEAKGGKTKTLKLLQGNLSFRTVPAGLRVGELTDALTTAKAVCPSAVLTVEQLDRKAFLDHATELFEQTGELLPGIERTEARESFSMKFGGKKGEVADGTQPTDL
jgi:phage host-nuclease inhibitor protein Gam